MSSRLDIRVRLLHSTFQKKNPRARCALRPMIIKLRPSSMCLSFMQSETYAAKIYG